MIAIIIFTFFIKLFIDNLKFEDIAVNRQNSLPTWNINSLIYHHPRV